MNCYHVNATTGHARANRDNPLYKVWKSMIANDVRVCDRWRDFATFRADMTETDYRPGMFLRLTNTRDIYEPGNVFWIEPEDCHRIFHRYQKG